MKIRKAVFPVAGLGTRVLPATKAMPKEMLTIVDKPLIQYVVDEAKEAGIEHFVFVTGRGKAVIEDHFDKQFELEATLKARGKTAELEALAREHRPRLYVTVSVLHNPTGQSLSLAQAHEVLREELVSLWRTEETRAYKPDVMDEVRNGLYYFESVLYDLAPEVAASLERAVGALGMELGADALLDLDDAQLSLRHPRTLGGVRTSVRPALGEGRR